MRNIISIRWKILTGLLILAILPMLLLTYLFSDIASSQVKDQMELMADQAGRYIMQNFSQQEDSILESLDLLGKDEALLNAVYFGQITGDPTQLHDVMKHNFAQFGFNKLELVHADGHRHVLTKGSKNNEPQIIKKSEGSEIDFVKESDSQLKVEKNRLVLIGTIPLNFQGALIGNLRAFHYIDDAATNEMQDMIGADIAFHDGFRIVTSSLRELQQKKLNLDQILDEDAVHMTLNHRSHIVYNYPLNHDTAGFLIALDRSSILAANRSMQKTLILIAVAVMTIAIVLGIIISRGIARPLDVVVANLQEIAEGDADLTKKLKLTSSD